MTSCETKFNATDYIRVDSRTMHGQGKLDEAVSAGQLIISYQILCQLKTVRIINIVIIIIVVVHVPPPSKTISYKWFFIKNKQRNKQTNKNMTFDHNL